MKAEIWARSVRTLIFTNSKSAKFYIETTCGRMGFQQFSRIHFFRNLPPEVDSDRILDFDLLIRASSRYFLGNELLRSPAGHLMQKLCNMKSRPPPRCGYPVTSFIYWLIEYRHNVSDQGVISLNGTLNDLRVCSPFRVFRILLGVL